MTTETTTAELLARVREALVHAPATWELLDELREELRQAIARGEVEPQQLLELVKLAPGGHLALTPPGRGMA